MEPRALGDACQTASIVARAAEPFGLCRSTPEVDLASLRWDVPLRDQVDLDSFDYLNFMIALHRASGVEVPESDYPKLSTLRGAVDYLAQRIAA